MLLTECEQVDNSYRWLCKNRKHFPANADIWHFRLRQQVKALHSFFNQFNFTFHPSKTFIGKIEKGFDWMGGRLNNNQHTLRISRYS